MQAPEQPPIQPKRKYRFGLSANAIALLQRSSIEAFVIVFSISLSLWLNNWNERRKQEADVQDFLVGLRQDLGNDIREMQGDSVSYKRMSRTFKYITSIGYGQTLHPDSIARYQSYIFNITGLVPNNGRFEGFKSSGKLGYIQDRELLNEIIDFYQESIPNLLVSTNSFTERKKDLFNYIELNLRRTSDSTNNLAELLSGDPCQNMSRNLVFTEEILQAYSNCMNRSRRMIHKIDSLYGKPEGQ